MKKNASEILFYVSILFLVILGAAAAAAPAIAPYDPVEQNLDQRFSPPAKSHLLGTDNLGRDLLSRIIYGSRVSLINCFGDSSMQTTG